MLQAVWRWIYAAIHQIEKPDKPPLLHMFRRMLYARTKSDFDEAKQKFETDPLVLKYPQYVDHIEKAYFSRIEKWALYHRMELQLPTADVNTNNFVERSFRILKDMVFMRLKAYNLPDVTSILLSDGYKFYHTKLVDVGNGRFSVNTSASTQHATTTYTKDQVVEICDSMFMVESSKDENVHYMVDMRNNFCECSTGKLGGQCKHKQAISVLHNVSELAVLPTFDAHAQAMHHYMATGTWLEDSFYRGLNETEATSNVTDYIEDRRAEPYQDVTSFDDAAGDGADQEDGLAGGGADQEDMSVDDEDDNEEESEVLWVRYLNAKVNLERKMREQLQDKDFRKCLKKYTTSMEKITSGNLKQHMYSFALPSSVSKQALMIPVQTTAISRRRNPHGGRGVSTDGRRVQDAPHRMEMVLDADDNDEEYVYHSLPPQRLPPKRKAHNLMAAVDSNQPNAKKH